MHRTLTPSSYIIYRRRDERNNSTTEGFSPKLLVLHKRGRDCIIAKVVIAQPLGEVVVAMPFRNRPTVEHVSLPPVALAYARKASATWWIVRLDLEGRCYGLPLDQVPKLGRLQQSDGAMEWFISLDRFTLIDWQDWEYVGEDSAVVLSPGTATIGLEHPSGPQQLALGLEVAP